MVRTNNYFCVKNYEDEHEMNKSVLVFAIIENLSIRYKDKYLIARKVKQFFPEWVGNMITFLKTKNYSLLYKFNNLVENNQL